MTTQTNGSPPAPGWKRASAASPSREDCAMTSGEGPNWSGFLWVFFRGRVVHGLAFSGEHGVELMPSMAGGHSYRHEIEYWHSMYEPAAPVAVAEA